MNTDEPEYSGKKREKKISTIGVRSTHTMRSNLQKLITMISSKLGTRVTQSQVIEIALKEAVARREEELDRYLRGK